MNEKIHKIKQKRFERRQLKQRNRKLPAGTTGQQYLAA